MASLPRPVSGLVVGYSYLWEAEFRAGREGGNIVVTVAPITHSPPLRALDALKLRPG